MTSGESRQIKDQQQQHTNKKEFRKQKQNAQIAGRHTMYMVIGGRASIHRMTIMKWLAPLSHKLQEKNKTCFVVVFCFATQILTQTMCYSFLLKVFSSILLPNLLRLHVKSTLYLYSSCWWQWERINIYM